MNDKDIMKIIDNIVWWIPFRKKRDELRNKLINLIIEKNKNEIFNSIDKVIELTNEINDRNKQKETLKNNLKLIEIETHSIAIENVGFVQILL